MAGRTTHLQFLWHFHQPCYRLPQAADFELPWVRLHSVKAYYDMGRMLEAHPGVRAVVNFSGALLEQLRDYVALGRRDKWWHLSLVPPEELTDEARGRLLADFFSISWETHVQAMPRYAELLARRAAPHDPQSPHAPLRTFSNADWVDLQLLFNLAWCGFSVREEFALVQALLARGRDFRPSDVAALLDVHIEVMGRLLPMYARLQARGQVEISVTPMYHPILPLLVDSDAAARATPDRPRPARYSARDAHWHVREALDLATDLFGARPRGVWPAEGSVSPEAVELLAHEGVEWIATDEDVLRLSRGGRWSRGEDLCRPWRYRTFEKPWIYFRDHGLSDQIGFVYSKNSAQAAVQDFLERVRQSASHSPQPAPVVSVILDGENPWEHYTDDGRAFLEALYRALEAAPDIQTTTPSAWAREGWDAGPLEYLHSGSWIMANYQIWIGHPETNLAWDLLGQARQLLCQAAPWRETEGYEGPGGAGEPGPASAQPGLAEAWRALRVAEGSDWFWWFGDDFTSPHDDQFDRLFRAQLRFVHEALGLAPPASLERPIMGRRTREIAWQAPRQLVRPRINGLGSSYLEWAGAGVYRNTGAHGSMFESSRFLDHLLLGFDLEHLYLRAALGPDLEASPREGASAETRLRVHLTTPRGEQHIEVVLAQGPRALLRDALGKEHALREVAWRDFLELGVAWRQLDMHPGEAVELALTVHRGALELERHPEHGALALEVPRAGFDARHWQV